MNILFLLRKPHNGSEYFEDLVIEFLCEGVVDLLSVSKKSLYVFFPLFSCPPLEADLLSAVMVFGMLYLQKWPLIVVVACYQRLLHHILLK